MPDATGEKTNWARKNWFLLAFIALILVIVVVAWRHGQNLSLKMVTPLPNVGELLVNTLLSLTAIALFLERSLEVIVKSSRAFGRTDADNEVLACDKTVEDRLSQIATLRKRIADENLIGQTAEMQAQLDHANAELEQARQMRKTHMKAVETYRTQTQKITHLCALVCGLLIAIAGVRALGPLFLETQANPPVGTPSPLRLFVYVDVGLTAGLIAGGADGLHKVISLATTYFDVSKDALSGKPKPGA